MNSQGMFGAQQGPSGASQGFQGTQEGLANGSNTGMQRAASGGMNPVDSPSSPGSGQAPQGLFAGTQRKAQGFNIGSLAPFASMIPGVGPLIGAGLGMIGSMQAQSQAANAAKAAQGAQGDALAGASGIAGQLSGPPDYSGIIKAEDSGINTLKSGVGGVANPNAVIGQMAGDNIGRAISGANANHSADLGEAARIEQGNATQYNQIGTQAGGAAAAQGNPFSMFSNALAGAGGLGGLLSGLRGPGGGGTTSTSNSVSDAGGLYDNQATATYGGGESVAPQSLNLNSGINSAPIAGATTGGGMIPPTPANPFAGGSTGNF